LLSGVDPSGIERNIGRITLASLAVLWNFLKEFLRLDIADRKIFTSLAFSQQGKVEHGQTAPNDKV